MLPASLAAAALLVALAGCGSDDDDGGPTATDVAATAADTLSADTMTHDTSASEMPIVAVNAVDYGFEDLPATVPAGSKLTLTNTSANEPHEIVVLGPLPADETRSVEELLALPEDELPAIEPATVIIAMPGEEGMAVVGDGTLTKPGRYAVICSFPVGLDPAVLIEALESETDGPPDLGDGPPHFTLGMFAELTVE